MRLKYLDISGNQLEGTLPLQLPPCLKQFDCSRNKLSGQIQFEELPPTLLYFDVSHNPSLGGVIRKEWVLQCPTLRYSGCQMSDGHSNNNADEEVGGGWAGVMKGPVLAGVSLANTWDISAVVHCCGHDGTGFDMKGNELVAEENAATAGKQKKKQKGTPIIAPTRPTGAVTMNADGTEDIPLALGGIGIDCRRRLQEATQPNLTKDRDGRGVGYVNWQREWLEGLNAIGITATYDIKYDEPRQGWREYHVDATKPPGRMRSLVGGRGGFNTCIEGGWYKEGDRVKADYECRGKKYAGTVMRRHRDDLYVCFTDSFRREFLDTQKWHGRQFRRHGKPEPPPISTSCARLRQRSFFEPHYKVAEGAPPAASPLDWERRMIHQVSSQHELTVIYKRLRKHTGRANSTGMVPMELTRRPVWYNYLEVQQAIWVVRCYAEGRRRGGLLQPKVLKEIPKRRAQVREVREAFVRLMKVVEARVAQEDIRAKKYDRMMSHYNIETTDKFAVWYIYLIDDGLEKFTARRFVEHLYETNDSNAFVRLRTDELDCEAPFDKFPTDYRFARDEPEAKARHVSRPALEGFLKIHCPDELSLVDQWLTQYSGDELVHDAFENFGAAPKYTLVDIPDPALLEAEQATKALGKGEKPTRTGAPGSTTKEAWSF
jgi:hypothetical protein